MYVEPDGTLWVGTVEGGLNRKGQKSPRRGSLRGLFRPCSSSGAGGGAVGKDAAVQNRNDTGTNSQNYCIFQWIPQIGFGLGTGEQVNIVNYCVT